MPEQEEMALDLGEEVEPYTPEEIDEMYENLKKLRLIQKYTKEIGEPIK